MHTPGRNAALAPHTWDHPRFVFVDKPAGVSTHATEAGPRAVEGFVEYLSRLRGEPLFVCHRLDKGTTGAMAFATSSAAAAELSALLKDRDVSKTYLFITDRHIPESEFEFSSHIEKRGPRFVSEAGEINAMTRFRHRQSLGAFSLWEARPHTGRPHQIRLHAEAKGIPILGDNEHGGSPFPTLCLHAHALEFDTGLERFSHACEAPVFFRDLSLLASSRLCEWLAATDRRERTLRSIAGVTQHQKSATTSTTTETDRRPETLRWIHTDGLELRAEQLGSIVDLQWFSDEPPTESDWQDIHTLTRLREWPSWRLQLRQDRGRNPNQQVTWTSGSLPEKWVAEENGLRFEFRTNQGLSSGLFLDQRANRAWIRASSHGARVLNLFCYTGGFSVAAAKGGAEKTVSVDVSRNFLDWSRRNFELNELDPAAHEFRAMDAREYVKYATKKGLNFDLIVCDPPSFGRSDKGVFRIEKDIRPLIVSLAALLGEGGRLLFCCNYEKWDDERFESEIQLAARDARLRPLRPPPPDWDFEMPGEPRIMKTALLLMERG